LQLKAGVHSIINFDAATVQVRKISNIHIHHLYRDGIPFDYDVAIAKTLQPFQLTRYVSIIERSRKKPQGYSK